MKHDLLHLPIASLAVTLLLMACGGTRLTPPTRASASPAVP